MWSPHTYGIIPPSLLIRVGMANWMENRVKIYLIPEIERCVIGHNEVTSGKQLKYLANFV